MASQESPLLTSSTPPSYRAINSSAKEDDSKGDVHPILMLYRDVRSGKQQIGRVFAYSLVAVMGAAFNGFMLGFTAVLPINIDKHGYPDITNYMEYIGSIATVGALIAGLLTGPISDKLGRRMSFILASIPYLLGFLSLSFSYSITFYHTSVQLNQNQQLMYLVFLLVGRALSGFGAGALSLVVPVYVTEIAPSSVRGLFGSLNQLSVTIGIFLVYLFNTIFPYYITCLIVIGLTVVFCVGVLWIHESPRWLVANGQELQASGVLYKIRGPRADVPLEMAELQKIIESQKEFSIVDKLRMFLTRPVFIPFIYSLILMFFQQFCGINIVIFYAGSVLKSAKVSHADLDADFGVGVIQIIATFVSVLLVDLVGRKKLLGVGGALLAISNAVLGVYFFVNHHYCPDNGKWYCSDGFGYVAVVCLAVFIIGFSIGWGPIPWLMMTELAPLKVRGIMAGIATAVNWSFATIITLLFNKYENLVHPYGAWWTFCGISVLSVAFSLIILPETKGKSLEEIEELFNKKFNKKGSNMDQIN